ncbi:PTS sugar transporter subunit IIA [Alkalicoccobacillus porphyridii]|uniref:PTS sugar transporter subunit IIA n=1 Tax=Alkalicoccobacillus porphyridii TaxID=2597270 RepID=A0A553ZTP2_9BACI|nr:PTS sugar transporter subunit IIA [Alkalicoccobacillus porphyridii]TSB44838.1 PTS sugar transporter subunit IIA [Alkalicoccobacillus porphyridii]
MDNNSFYHVYVDMDLKTKEDVYSFISSLVSNDEASQKETIQQLNQREQAGSTLIAEHVMLPHLESTHIKKSEIVFIRLAEPIQTWDAETEDIRLLIVILLKENESAQIKKDIAAFTRTLADDDYVNQLVTIQDKDMLYKVIKKY